MAEELAARYAAGRLYVGCLHGLRQLQGGFDRRKQPQTDRSLLHFLFINSRHPDHRHHTAGARAVLEVRKENRD
eukprot:SAG22_NODE_2086_length_3031_cov_4.223056_2_plen_74_part_00